LTKERKKGKWGLIQNPPTLKNLTIGTVLLHSKGGIIFPDLGHGMYRVSALKGQSHQLLDCIYGSLKLNQYLLPIRLLIVPGIKKYRNYGAHYVNRPKHHPGDIT
jgi:hypothetical protein